MSGHHNITIYTEGDNPWCKDCLNGDFMKSASTFKDGGWICWGENANPTKKGCPGFKKAKKKKSIKPTIGCRCRILAGTSWKEYKNQECILAERSGSGDFSFILLENHPKLVMDGSVYYNQCAWITEDQLEVIDTDFARNIPFIDWVNENEDNFCPDCLTWLDGNDVCPECGCEI